MKQSTKRFISFTFGLIFLVGSFVVYVNFIRPAYEEAQTYRGEIYGKQEFIKQQKQVVQTVKNLIAEYKGGEQLQDAISKFFPLKPDVADALVQINGLIANNQMAFQSVRVSEVNSGTRLKKDAGKQLVKQVGSISFQIAMSGSYQNMKRFLEGLETNVRIFEIRDFSVDPKQSASPKGSAQSDSYNYNVTVAAFYQIP